MTNVHTLEHMGVYIHDRFLTCYLLHKVHRLTSLYQIFCPSISHYRHVFGLYLENRVPGVNLHKMEPGPPYLGIERRTFLMWGDSATHSATRRYVLKMIHATQRDLQLAHQHRECKLQSARRDRIIVNR